MIEKILAGLAIWVFVSFVVLPCIINNDMPSDYMEDLMCSFGLQIIIAVIGCIFFTLYWAINVFI